MRNRVAVLLGRTVSVIPLVLCSTAGAQQLKLNSIPRPLAIYNTALSAEVESGTTLQLSAKGGTNLFVNPAGGYHVVDAPMALFAPDENFVLTAKASAVHRNIYDVAALVIYQDENLWAKLCFENSIKKEPTIVTVVTRDYSDDCNSTKVNAAYAYLGVARKGQELSFHYSPDGKTWELVRHFRLALKDGAKVGFAVHGSRGDGFSASFSDVTYAAAPLANMRQMESSPTGSGK